MTDPSFEQPLDELDIALLDELRATLEAADPMPADLDERVQLALTVQALHAELAELQRMPVDLAGVRSHDYTRVDTVTFTSESMSAVVTISRVDNDTVRIDGWLDGDLAEVELRERQRTSTAPVDAEGRFAFADVERGLVQFVFRFADGDTSPVITPSMEV
ncbi:carboxypeptidase regulatory-like domain-containing protein [Pseudactinotalea terrae]|uniref:carboxypeptidase regulatory-like domain-containing protein n=1 Tax=Pseudactinotalea terrae TaxID=1743262 RepID=UPI0012E1C5B2|nr:carboxypeptidase regulatory-like domain-containing protein [Pseudactinotalea terrae]